MSPAAMSVATLVWAIGAVVRAATTRGYPAVARGGGARGRVARLAAVRRRIGGDHLAEDLGEVRRLRSALATGSSLLQGIDALAAGQGAWAQGAARVAAQIRAGRLASAALDDWAHASDRPGLRLLSDALVLADQTGGAHLDAIDAVASVLADRAELAREVRAMAASARASAVVLVVLPVVFAAMVAVADPRVGAFLFGTSVGLGCLVAAAVLDLAGAWWMRRTIRRVVW